LYLLIAVMYVLYNIIQRVAAGHTNNNSNSTVGPVLKCRSCQLTDSVIHYGHHAHFQPLKDKSFDDDSASVEWLEESAYSVAQNRLLQ